MPSWEPFTPTTALPIVGKGYEKSTLDLKKTYRVGPQPPAGTPDTRPLADYEIAKDVAAFANGIGGTILVGIQENRAQGNVAGWFPLDVVELLAHTKAIDNAIEKRCRPRPLHVIERVPCQGDHVLAVNVWPYPPGAVSVRADADPNADYQGRSWVFPLRIGERSTYLEPEQLPMLMLPQLRRAIVLLEQIGKGSTVQLTWDENGLSQPYTVEDFDGITNFVRLKENKTLQVTTYPLECVRLAWKETSAWRIVMSFKHAM